MSVLEAFAIKSRDGRIIPYGISFTRSHARKTFIKDKKTKWKDYYKIGYRCVPVLITEQPEVNYTLHDIIDAVQYGFDYREESQHNGKNVPNGNVLQWLMGKKNLIDLPEEFKKYKVTEITNEKV